MNKYLKRFLVSTSLIVVSRELPYMLISMPPEKYSREWIGSLSNGMWEKEREIVRQSMCNPKLGMEVQSECQNILRLFDKIKSERVWAGKKPMGSSYSREHGYNLYKND